MSELITARDKLPQMENQIKAAEMEHFVLAMRVQFDPGTTPVTASDFTKAAHQALKSEADASRAGLILWEYKLAVMRPIYEKLKAEMEEQDRKALKTADAKPGPVR